MVILGLLLLHIAFGAKVCFDMDQWGFTRVAHADTGCYVRVMQPGGRHLLIGQSKGIRGGWDNWECINLSSEFDKNKPLYVWVHYKCTDAMWVDYFSVLWEPVGVRNFLTASLEKSYGTKNNKDGFCISGDINDAMGAWRDKVGGDKRCALAVRLSAPGKSGNSIKKFFVWSDLWTEFIAGSETEVGQIQDFMLGQSDDQPEMSYEAISNSWVEGLTVSEVVVRVFACLGALTVVYYTASLLYRLCEAKQYDTIDQHTAEI